MATFLSLCITISFLSFVFKHDFTMILSLILTLTGDVSAEGFWLKHLSRTLYMSTIERSRDLFEG